MRKISAILLSIILLSGCATVASLRKPEGNQLELPRLGMKTDTINNELVVKDFTKTSAADLTGVKRGDIVVSIDGKAITTQKALLYVLDNKHEGEHVLLVINRNGKHITFDIEPQMIKALRTLKKIQNLLLEDQKVSIAIIVSEVKNSFKNVPPDWSDSMRNQLQSTYEGGLLKFADESGLPLSVVDRSRLKQILGEFQFSQSGFVSDKVRAKIGEMTGATHIVDISFSRFPSGFGKDDILNARLIEIETGKILAVDQIKGH
jgi:hypothetical protein